MELLLRNRDRKTRFLGFLYGKPGLASGAWCMEINAKPQRGEKNEINQVVASFRLISRYRPFTVSRFFHNPKQNNGLRNDNSGARFPQWRQQIPIDFYTAGCRVYTICGILYGIALRFEYNLSFHTPSRGLYRHVPI